LYRGLEYLSRTSRYPGYSKIRLVGEPLQGAQWLCGERKTEDYFLHPTRGMLTREEIVCWVHDPGVVFNAGPVFAQSGNHFQYDCGRVVLVTRDVLRWSGFTCKESQVPECKIRPRQDWLDYVCCPRKESWEIAIECARYAPRFDEEGGLVGWRCWRYDHTTGLLRSPYRKTVWTRSYLRAQSSVTTVVRKEAGIHAHWTKTDVRKEVFYSDASTVIGEVRGYGHYAFGPEGWRAEECVILQLVVLANMSDIAVVLSKRYGVPVHISRLLS